MASNSDTRFTYPADKARQGRIVLNTPLRRRIFFGGLVALVLVILVTPFVIESI